MVYKLRFVWWLETCYDFPYAGDCCEASSKQSLLKKLSKTLLRSKKIPCKLNSDQKTQI